MDEVAAQGISAAWLAERLPDRTAQALAADIAQLITHGEISPDTRLPSVRALAADLRVSPATVSAAWQRLRARGVLRGTGRGGTFVQAGATPRPVRYEAEGHFGEGLRHDLGVSVPDPELLPDLQSVITRVGGPDLHRYDRIQIVAELDQAARRDWPYRPRSLMATNGGYEALMLALHTFVQPGNYVLVENPSPPRMLDLVDSTGARTIFLDRDDHGVRPESLADALRRRPTVLILQPGVHNPVGSRMTAERRDQLADLLIDSDVLVIEDDGQGSLLGGPIHALGETGLDHHLYIRSYSKSHGPDLRLAVVEGPEPVLIKVHAYRGYGSGWTSRFLQRSLAMMLADQRCRAKVRAAARTYHRRRKTLWRALADRGIECSPGAGLDLWVPVRDERYALITLAAHGIAVSSGSRFCAPGSPAMIRVSTSMLPAADVPEVADSIARAVDARSDR